MAPRLEEYLHILILAKIRGGDINEKIASYVSSSEHVVTSRAIRRIRSTYERYGTATTPANQTGPDRKITPLMLDALLHKLVKKQSMSRREIASFLYERFDLDVSATTIMRAMQSNKIT